MILLACSCLNIRIHGRGIACNLEDAHNLGVPDSILSDSFFELPVYTVIPDLAGVTTSQKGLCKLRCIENWTVTTCVCCMMDIFAQDVNDNNKVLVSSRAETNSNFISTLLESEQYSSVFKLILPEINDNFIQNNKGIQFHNGNIDHSIEHVQSQVSNYIKDQQKAMEERIRKFTEQQQSIYTNLLQKVRKNKQAMVYLMIKCKESQIEGETVSETSLGSPSALNKDSANESSTSTDSAFDKSDALDLPLDNTSNQQNLRSLRRTVSNPARPKRKVKRTLKRAPASIDVGGVFDMEEFETKESFPFDMDEFDPKDSLLCSDGTDESENEASVDAIPERPDERDTCATSLPMSIPALSNYPHFSLLEEEERDPCPKAPDDIAASMRALACSVRDGTEMFGELPRRRLNTGDLLAFRPF